MQARDPESAFSGNQQKGKEAYTAMLFLINELPGGKIPNGGAEKETYIKMSLLNNKMQGKVALSAGTGDFLSAEIR